MKTKTLRQILLYNYRYIFAYALMTLFIVYFLFWQLGTVASGLSHEELHNAALHTNALQSLQSPLYPLFSKLQVLSLKLFGINSYSIRIPSVIIALSTLLLLFQVLKKWFGRPTALLSILLVSSADWFLFTARQASGAIELSFWLAVALFTITKVLERRYQWLGILVISLTMLLFVPFGVYAMLVIGVGLCTSKVLRQRIFEAPRLVKILSGLLAILSLGYLGFAISRDVNTIPGLLGLSDGIPTPLEYLKQLTTNGASTVAVLPAMSPLSGPSGVFFVRFFELTFVLFGVFMFWKTRINRLNLVVIALAIVLFFASGLSYANGASSLLIVPSIIFITAGVRYFMHRWQKTFPKNPYARMAAFVPILILLAATTYVHQQSYFVLWPHQTATRGVFVQDLALAQNELRQATQADCVIVTDNTDLQMLLQQSSGHSCSLTFASTTPAVARDQLVLIQAQTLAVRSVDKGVVQKMIVSDQSQDALRWVALTRAD